MPKIFPRNAAPSHSAALLTVAPKSPLPAGGRIGTPREETRPHDRFFRS
ncbi:MAG: hypothetical protein MZV64_12835 [Ignavibacteriales bacterium]|nr:hypothetical protein [Ignavibacteriales bacterium]